MKARRGLCYVLVGLCSLFQMEGCAPLLSGAFAMMCLEGGKKGWLLLCTLLGVAAVIPWLEAVRYLITIIIIVIGSLILEKMYGRQDSLQMSILTLGAVILVGLSGIFMESNWARLASVVLEGVFSFGMILTFNRFIHWFLTPKGKIFVTREAPEDERSERVGRYISACEKLASVFAVPQYEYAGVKHSVADNVVGQSRMAISQQLLAIAGNIEKCTKEEVYLCKEDRQSLRRLEYELKENGIFGRQFSLYEDENGRHRVEFYAYMMPGQNLSLRNLGELVSQVLDMPMSPREGMKTFLNREERKVVFVETGRYRVLGGHCKLPGGRERICGDNDFFCPMYEGRYEVAAVSDGMGIGPVAAKESELVLELTEELLGAGFSPEQALPMLNSACSMRGEASGCSTLDLCMIDTFTGRGSWYKMGAAASFLLRHNEGEVIYGNTLPVGATEHFRILKQERQLEDGDSIVLMTDGVLEALPSMRPEEMMKEILLKIEEDTPGNMAENILNLVCGLCNIDVRDDMLVMVLRIWER